jgi:ribokinase
MSILVIGGTAVDIIFPAVPRLPAWPDHTEFTPANLVLLGQAPLVTIGGNGANAAYIAGRAGARVTLCSNAGPDAFGRLAQQWLSAAGAKLKLLPGRARTAVNVTAANARLQRATFFYPGCSVPLPLRTTGYRQVLICGWPHPPLTALARLLPRWRATGSRTALDIGPLIAGRPPSLARLRPVLDGLDLFLANEHELFSITRTSSVTGALDRLRRVYTGDVVVKLGSRGALWLPAGAHSPRHFSGRRTKAVNTVGAGDTFNGALLAALAERCDFPAAMRAANTTAARVVRSPHGVLGLP